MPSSWTESGEITYERHFGRCLFAGSRFEQERTQLHRASERDAYDAASDRELHWEGERCNCLDGLPTVGRPRPTRYTVTSQGRRNRMLIAFIIPFNGHILTTCSSSRSFQGLMICLPSPVEFSAMTLSRSICVNTLSEDPPISSWSWPCV